MTLSEAYEYIDLKLDKRGTGSVEDAEKRMFILEAIEEFLDTVSDEYSEFAHWQNKVRTIISEAPLTFTSSYAPVPNDFARYLESAVNGEPARHYSAGKMLFMNADTIKQSVADDPAVYLVGSNIKVGHTFSGSGSLVYLRQPTLGVNSGDLFLDLPNPGQFEVLKIAVRLSMLSVEDPRYPAAGAEEEQD